MSTHLPNTSNPNFIQSLFLTTDYQKFITRLLKT